MLQLQKSLVCFKTRLFVQYKGVNKMEMRLQKYLANSGVASRRKAEIMILEGLVSVNGQVVQELGTKINTKEDIITYKGKPLELSKSLVYIMLHKPEGYITTSKDQYDRPTVMDIVRDIGTRVYPVGRLDYDTSGLLIMTNDGELTYKLTHPKHNIEKVYIAKVIGVPDSNSLEKFRNGIMIDNYKTAKAKIDIVKSDGRTCSLKIIIKEGKNRQVRKMCEAIGHRTIALKRVATGKLFLGELKRGDHRHLTKAETNYLKNL